MGLAVVSWVDTKTQVTKAKIGSEIQSCPAEKTISRVKRQPMELEIVFSIHISD